MVVDGKVDLDSGVADEVGGVTADETGSMPMKGGLKTTADETGSMPMKEDLKTTADETGSMPMGRRTVRFPS